MNEHQQLIEQIAGAIRGARINASDMPEHTWRDYLHDAEIAVKVIESKFLTAMDRPHVMAQADTLPKALPLITLRCRASSLDRARMELTTQARQWFGDGCEWSYVITHVGTDEVLKRGDGEMVSAVFEVDAVAGDPDALTERFDPTEYNHDV